MWDDEFCFVVFDSAGWMTDRRGEICKIAANFNMIIALNFAHDPSPPATNPRKIRARRSGQRASALPPRTLGHVTVVM